VGAIPSSSSLEADRLRQHCYFVCLMSDTGFAYQSEVECFEFTDMAKFKRGLSSNTPVSSWLRESMPPVSMPPLFAIQDRAARRSKVERDDEARILRAKAGLYTESSALFGTPAAKRELDVILGMLP
jgi:hypothetical protein